MPLGEKEGCFDSLQAERCTEGRVLSGGWCHQGPTEALRWHPTGWHRTARQSLNVGCLRALGSQHAADLRKAWQQTGPSCSVGNQNCSRMELSEAERQGKWE